MRVLVNYESSAVVRDAFRGRGHDAWSCDLLPCEGDPRWHIIGDALEVMHGGGWDIMIAHPPCTYLCSSGMHWTARGLRDPELTEKALEAVRALLSCGIPRIAIENPVGAISTRIRPASQYVQPYQFGHDASKRTGLWLVGLPLLTPTQYIPPRIVNGKARWANQTDSGQNRLAPSPDRWRERSRTYSGIAAAMAEQWGNAQPDLFTQTLSA
jgi:hypothetical protein